MQNKIVFKVFLGKNQLYFRNEFTKALQGFIYVDNHLNVVIAFYS